MGLCMCVRACVRACVCACVRACVRACVCACVHRNIHTHACTHTHIVCMQRLSVYLRAVFAWTHSGKELRPSNKRPGLYDQPDEAIAWLKNFKAANASFVSTMRLSQEHVWNKRDSSAAGEGLGKVIDYVSVCRLVSCVVWSRSRCQWDCVKQLRCHATVV